ncbi:MAG: PcfB family protein, partial [Aristaeellaceae bacterium]
MYNGGEAADQMVSYAFKGGEVVLRLSGAAAKNLAVYLTALLKQGGPSKGKTTLKRMIADGKELTVQRIDTDQIPYFNAMAKKYGVMFVAVRDRKNPDGKCDIMFRLEDSARVNRIFDRLAISEHPDVAHIKSEIIRSREEKQNPQ